MALRRAAPASPARPARDAGAPASPFAVTSVPATMRVELARETDEDPRGNVASFRPLRPWYGLEELDPVRMDREVSAYIRRFEAANPDRHPLIDGPHFEIVT